MAEDEIIEEVYDEVAGKYITVPKLPKKRWKLIVTTREATKEIEPLTLPEATRLSKCLLQVGENIASTKIKEIA